MIGTSTESSMTAFSRAAVELSGLTHVERPFAHTLAASAIGLVLWLGFNEPWRTFAIAAALGARPRQPAAFGHTEAAFVSIGGHVVADWAVRPLIVRVLTGVLDPPPPASPGPLVASRPSISLGSALSSPPSGAWSAEPRTRPPTQS